MSELECMKICVECRYYNDAGSSWMNYQHECHAPKERNPVTGKGYVNCEKKNPDGNCQDYEAKERKEKE